MGLVARFPVGTDEIHKAGSDTSALVSQIPMGAAVVHLLMTKRVFDLDYH